jgi:outer membrane protein OmpA-like peptidoglycan-associated protein
LDNDADGLADAQDKCPAVAEDKDGFEDTDGCPDLDNDNDGIPDLQDKCPNQPENKNGFEDEDGCEDIAEKPIDSVTVMPLHFETGTSNIDYNGKIYLDDIAKRLVAWKTLNVGIRVWEARKGKLNPKTRAKEDSILVQTTGAKANAVAKYLSEKGVALERIQVKGEGPLVTTTPEEAAAVKPGTHKVVMEIISAPAVSPEGNPAQ